MSERRHSPLGEEDRQILLEQYKLAVEMWDRVRARRLTSNTLYVTINSGIITAVTFFLSKEVEAPSVLVQSYLSVAGLVVCVLWFVSILNYRRLTDDKYAIICRLERLLPAAPFTDESAPSDTDGKTPARRRFTVIERLVPFTFAVLYVTMLLPFG